MTEHFSEVCDCAAPVLDNGCCSLCGFVVVPNADQSGDLLGAAHDLIVRASRWMAGVLPSQEIPGSSAQDRSRWLSDAGAWRDKISEERSS
jgi:hypothetical protein